MKTAVITGATKGIGKALAEMFLEKGFSLVFCARTNEAVIDLRKNWQKKYPNQKVFAFPLDMGDKESVKNFGKSINQYFPEGVEVLVNNAGLFLPGNLTDEPEGRLETLMSVHVFGAYHLTRSLLPKMIENKRGHIFNMCSVASLHAYPNGGSYGIAKYALLGFTENLRFELKDKGIKVTVLVPGAVWTDSWKHAGVPESRLMETNDIAKLVWSACNLSPKANVDKIIVKPQLGDL